MRIRERSAAGGGSGRQSVPAPTLGTPGGGERLPMAPRERKPALAALAVLLILIGALGATVLVMRAGNKISVVKITAPVAAGDPIPESAITEVMLSDDSGLDFVKWSQRKSLAEYRAATNLVAESVLVGQMITPKAEVLTADKALVGLSLKDNQYPSGLKVGDSVAAYLVGNDAAKSQTSSGGTDGTLDSTLLSAHMIVKFTPGPGSDSGLGGGDFAVTVLVDAVDAAKLTIAASANEVALVRVAPSKN